MENVIVSACLLGTACRYDGKSRADSRVISLIKKANLIPVCAEILGGLPTPRVPAEIVGDKVIRRDGADVTEEYVRGAKEVLRLAELYGCRYALLKERSPSCGKRLIYDGTFSGTLSEGDGITAKLLEEHGISVFGESETEKLEALL